MYNGKYSYWFTVRESEHNVTAWWPETCHEIQSTDIFLNDLWTEILQNDQYSSKHCNITDNISLSIKFTIIFVVPFHHYFEFPVSVSLILIKLIREKNKKKEGSALNRGQKRGAVDLSAGRRALFPDTAVSVMLPLFVSLTRTCCAEKRAASPTNGAKQTQQGDRPSLPYVFEWAVDMWHVRLVALRHAHTHTHTQASVHE